MQKITKKILFGVFLFLILFGFITQVSAATGYVFTVGTKYDDSGSPNSDSRATAIYAGNYFEGMGYTKRTLPLNSGNYFTYSDFMGTISGSRYWFQADITYYVGHASYSNVSWKYNTNPGIMFAYSSGTATGYTVVPVTSYSMSQTRLAVFMGCLTGSQSSNISSVTYSRGAKSTVGWTTDVPAPETTTWTGRFLGKLVVNNTVQQAVTYANSFTYTYPLIKNAKAWGGSTTVPIVSSLKTALSLGLTSDNITIAENDNREHIINATIDDKLSKESNIEILLGNIIKSKVSSNFNQDDFIVKTSQEQFVNSKNTEVTKIYDFYLKIGGIRTNIGYTVFVEGNTVTSIYDNMKNYDVTTLKANNIMTIKEKSQNFSESRIVNMRAKALNRGDYITTILDEEKIYNVEENKTYYIIVVKETDSITQNSSVDYYTEEL